MREATRVVRAGLPAAAQGTPFLPGPTFAGVYHAAGDLEQSPYTYGRYHNPTWTYFEDALSALEGGPSVVFASGMAATAALLSVTLRPGEVLVLPADGYYTTRLLADGYFRQMGVQTHLAPTAGNEQERLLEGARLLWLESPSNPQLDVCDVAALAAAAHAHGALVAVDNTTPTPLGQQPLALGADFVVASDTKALTGHADLMLGHVAAREASWAERLHTWRSQTGAIPGPMEVWLAHRSLATLELRLERQCQTALRVATYLATRPDVQLVRYPGLPTDPAYEIAQRQMRRFGPIVSFALATRAAAERFLGACTLIVEATSFGGVLTTAERRARWGGDTVPEGFIRLSVGCEDAEDILADLAQALDQSQPSGASAAP
jgi:cystathionine gamma-lyase